MTRSVHKLFKISHNKHINALPSVYLDHWEETRREPARVVDSPPETKYLDYNQDYQTGYVYRQPDQRIPVTVAPWGEKGLWGGHGYVSGFSKPKKMRPRITTLWYPSTELHTLYSEVLDIYMNVEVTYRALELIDQHRGLDFYLLDTPFQDLESELGKRLKHKILVALALEKDRDYIKTKYANYIKPLEEVSWYGLKVRDALVKFRAMRVEESIEPPLRQTYARLLLQQLKEQANDKALAEKGG